MVFLDFREALLVPPQGTTWYIAIYKYSRFVQYHQQAMFLPYAVSRGNARSLLTCGQGIEDILICFIIT